MHPTSQSSYLKTYFMSILALNQYSTSVGFRNTSLLPLTPIFKQPCVSDYISASAVLSIRLSILDFMNLPLHTVKGEVRMWPCMFVRPGSYKILDTVLTNVTNGSTVTFFYLVFWIRLVWASLGHPGTGEIYTWNESLSSCVCCCWN